MAEIVGNGIICLMDTSLLYLFVGIFLDKRKINKIERIFPFFILVIIHFICTIFHLETSPLKVPIYILLDALFCLIQFRGKWYKYAVNIGLFYIMYHIIDTFALAIFNLFTNFDAAQMFSYDLSMFVIIIIVRLLMLMIILIIRSMIGRSIHQRQWLFFSLMPILTFVFVWLIYPKYWNMGNQEIDKLLTYVGFFLVIQNIFVFFYVISLQSSTERYFEMKAAYDRQRQYSGTITTIQKAIRKMAHDIRHHFIYLMSALEQEDIPKAKNYLIELDESLDNMVPLNVTGHYEIDALLHVKAIIADRLGVHIKVEGELPPEIMISPIDLNALLGNSLDNAIEAASRVDGQKEIVISFGYNASRLNFIITNPYIGQIQKNPDGHFISQKADGGLGTEIINEVVTKYDGVLLTEFNEGRFILKAMLQI